MIYIYDLIPIINFLATTRNSWKHFAARRRAHVSLDPDLAVAPNPTTDLASVVMINGWLVKVNDGWLVHDG